MDWALVRLSTVTVLCVVCVCRFCLVVMSFEYCFVVSSDKGFHVLVAAITYAYSVSVKEFGKFVIRREVFVNKL